MPLFIVDTDGGTDDALALLMLLGNGKAPDLITTCFGNVSLKQATRNCLDIVAAAGAAIPVHAGSAGPMVGALVNAHDVHGEDGLGGVERPVEGDSVASDDGVGVLARALQEGIASGSKVDLLMLGPLTNLALVLKDKPELGQGIGRLWIMGGTCRGRGNITAAAEFNIYCDPEAAQVVLSQPLNTLVVPWEPCLQTTLPGAGLDVMFSRLPQTPLTVFARGICESGRALARDWYGEDSLIMPDPLAAACVLDEQTATRTMICAMLVETGGTYSRGATIVDYESKSDQPVVAIVEKADRTKLEKYFEQALKTLA